MAPSAGRLQQTSLTSVPDISTSDHKPVVSSFQLQPSAPIPRTFATQSLIRVTGLSLCDISASDFCERYPAIERQGPLNTALTNGAH